MTVDVVQRIQDAYEQLATAAGAARYLSDHYLHTRAEKFIRRRQELFERNTLASSEAEAARRARVDAAIAARRVSEDAALAARSDVRNTLVAQVQALSESHPWALAVWDDPSWGNYQPPAAEQSHTEIRLGSLELPLWDGLPPIPAVVDLLTSRHVLIGSKNSPSSAANEIAQAAVLRFICATTPGSVRIGLIDPLRKGQELSAFLRLPSSLRLGDKVATTPAEIDRLLADLMGDVVEITQTRLTNVYDSIEDYNVSTTGLALPYRVLIFTDFPTGFSDQSAELLLDLARIGPRTGVHLIGTFDPTSTFPKNFDIAELTALATNLYMDEPCIAIWDDAKFGQYRVRTDKLPDSRLMNTWLDRIGHVASTANGGLPFERIAITPRDRWHGTTIGGIHVQIGVDSRGDEQDFVIGTGAIHHGLIGGDTQMGKTNLLHVLLTQLALKYSPEELELYLLDFKEVEFERYLIHELPHARAIASRTDREFGLSVLQRFREEIETRSKLFMQANVTHITDYRREPARILPRALVVMDEFQFLFRDDDRLSKEAGALLADIAQRGAAFGLHLLLSSQSPGGQTTTYLRPIYGQMALRIALGCREGATSQAILGEGNNAATRLTKPGEAIYNDRAGDPKQNPSIRIAELPNKDRDGWLDAITELKGGHSYPKPVTLDPDAPALLDRNAAYVALTSEHGWDPPGPSVDAWLGEPIAIKSPTTAKFERYLRSNLLIVGDEATSYGLVLAAIRSVAAQRSPAHASFVVLDFARPSSPFNGFFAPLNERLPHQIDVASPRAAGVSLEGAGAELLARLADQESWRPDLFLIVVGLHRWQEALVEVRYGEQSEHARRLIQFADEGPEVGCHLLLWSDSVGPVDRAFKRSGMGLFDLRVALRMPEPDSIALLGTPAASRLEDNRGLFRLADWEAGRTEKFKPYAVASQALIESIPFNSWSTSSPRTPDE